MVELDMWEARGGLELEAGVLWFIHMGGLCTVLGALATFGSFRERRRRVPRLDIC